MQVEFDVDDDLNMADVEDGNEDDLEDIDHDDDDDEEEEEEDEEDDFGKLYYYTLCTPSIFNLDQKFHGLSCFWGFRVYKRVQNQLRKTSVIRLPKE